jgi:beta-lactamase regulating signal transducer with metallopeptidase domain
LVLLKFAMPPLGILPTSVFNHLSFVSPASSIEAKAPVVSASTDELAMTELTAIAVSASPAVAVSASLAQNSATEPVQLSWLAYLMLLHLAGAVCVLLFIGLNWLRLRQLAASAEAVDNPRILALYRDTADRLDIQSLPELLVAEQVTSPVAFGCWRARILLPADLADSLSPDGLRTVLAHELAHHRRRDIFWTWLQLLLGAVWWFHPLYWMTAASLRSVREECCDDLLLAADLTTCDIYCTTLLDTARAALARQQPGHRTATAAAAALGFAEQLHPLAHRIRRIRDARLHRSSGLSLGAGGVVLALALVLLPGAITPAPDSAPTASMNPATMPSADTSTPSDIMPMADAITESSGVEEQDFFAGDDVNGEFQKVEVAGRPGYEHTIKRTIDAKPGGQLSMKANDGHIGVSGFGDSNITILLKRRVIAETEEEARKLLEAHRVIYQSDGTNLNLESSVKKSGLLMRSPVHGIAFEMQVPREYNIKLAANDGHIHVDQITGRVEAKSDDGHLRLTQIDGPVSGHSSDGHIHLEDLTGPVHASTDDGHISGTRFNADAKLETSDGHIKMRDMTGNISARTDDGHISFTEINGAADLATEDGHIKIGYASGPLTARTDDGHIMVEKMEGAARLITGEGNIKASFTAQPPDDCLLQTGEGNIAVTIPKSASLEVLAQTGEGRIGAPFMGQAGQQYGNEEKKRKVQATLNGGDVKLRVIVEEEGNIAFNQE